VHLLQAVLEHRPVDFVREASVDLHLVPGGGPEEVPVMGGVVDRAECQPVGHHGTSAILGVTDDVRRNRQLGVPEAAHCTRARVGVQDLLAKDRLMEALLRQAGRVDLLRCRQRREVQPVVAA
jgi:hypothetical protein